VYRKENIPGLTFGSIEQGKMDKKRKIIGKIFGCVLLVTGVFFLIGDIFNFLNINELGALACIGVGVYFLISPSWHRR